MQDLTPDQATTLAKFKENVKDIAKPEYNDRFYTRWLIARDFDLNKAEKMLRDHLLWRKKYDIDDIGNWEKPIIMRNYYPQGYCGEARNGTPVVYIQIGKMDIKGMYYGARQQDMLKSLVKDFYYLDEVLAPEQSKKHGRLIDQVTMVYDLEGFERKTLWKPMIDRITSMMQHLDLNYPERLGRVVIINVPWIFPIFWNVIKHAMSDATKNKIVLLGSNWKSEIQQYIAPDELPQYWGGNAPDPPKTPTTEFDHCWGGKIPEEFKIQKPEIDTSRFITETVKRGSSLQVEVIVNVAGSVLEWQFLTEGHDIGFGVYRRTEEKRQKAGEMHEVYKSERVNSHLFPEDGSVQCDTTGTYVLRFDNTYSWTTQKSVSYTTDLMEPCATDDIHTVAD